MKTSIPRNISKKKPNSTLNSRADHFESRAMYLFEIQTKLSDCANVDQAVCECSKIVFDLLCNSEAALYISMGDEQRMLDQIVETQIALYELFIKLDDMCKDSADSYFE